MTNNIMNFLTLTAETIEETALFTRISRTYAVGADREIRVVMRVAKNDRANRVIGNRIVVSAAIRDPHEVVKYNGYSESIVTEEWRTKFIGEREVTYRSRGGHDFDKEMPHDLVAMAWGLLMHWQA